MPLLLLLPLLVLGVVLAWLLLLPVMVVQRYRRGRARQRAVAWVVGTNAWLLLLSAVGLVAGAWLAQRWIDGAVPLVLSGLGVGVVAGVLGIALARIETTSQGRFHTPNAWLVLLLTALVAARILLGLWQGWNHLKDGHAARGLLAEQGSLLALAGVLLGYYLAYAWGLRRALRARQ
jgi:hypothetical protein